jgi:hypothetical protein
MNSLRGSSKKFIMVELVFFPSPRIRWTCPFVSAVRAVSDPEKNAEQPIKKARPKK